MRKYAPLLTLVSVVLLGVGLVVANMISTPTRPAPAAASAARAAAAPPAAAAPAPSAAAAEPGPASAPAPAAAPAVTQKAYTGRTAGNEATVAVAVNDGKATAYVCDGKNIEAWLSGSLDGDRLWVEFAAPDPGPDGDGTRQGWAEILDGLADYLAKA